MGVSKVIRVEEEGGREREREREEEDEDPLVVERDNLNTNLDRLVVACAV